MKYAAEITSGGMIYILSFTTIGSDNQVILGSTDPLLSVDSVKSDCFWATAQ
jgi:hypothetical protein